MGRKQDALRGLIRKFPPPDDVKVILDGLFDEADRSAALVGASLLESTLERLLTLNLKVKTPDIRNQLFQVRGPLGDFSAKITVGVGVGFISEAIGIELNIVRTIRNVFAHAITTVTFETTEIKAEIGRSKIIEITRDRVGPPKLPVAMTKREFVMLVQILFVILDHDQRELGGLALGL